MRHMGNSGKLAIITAVVALLMLVLTALTLEEPVMFTFLALVALAYVAALFEVLSRRRYAVAAATGVGTSLTIAFALAFISTWELAFAGQPSFFGTPLPTGDPDNYFFLSAASSLSTLLVLFAGAAWPSRKRMPARTPASPRRPATAARRPAARPRSQSAPGQRTSQSTAQRVSQGASASRTPTPRVPAGAAKRPSSSASSVRKAAPAGASKPKPAPKPGSKAAPRR